MTEGLARSAAIQGRVLGALLMREILTRYGRHNVGFLWLFLEPMLFTLGVTALWTATKAVHGHNMPIVAFAVTGYSSVLLWRNCTNRCVMAVEPNLGLLFHRNVRVMDLFLSRILLEVAGATVSLMVLSAAFVAMGWMEPPADLLRAIAAWLLLAWFAASLSLVVGALTERFEVVERVWHTITYLLFPLSGAVFMVDWLPRAWHDPILLLPMVHGVEMLRSGWFGGAVATHYDAGYVVATCMVLSFCGIAFARDAGRRVKPA